jgi:hypothetical protein
MKETIQVLFTLPFCIFSPAVEHVCIISDNMEYEQQENVNVFHTVEMSHPVAVTVQIQVQQRK